MMDKMLVIVSSLAVGAWWKIVGVMLSMGFGLAAYTRGYAYSTATRSEEGRGVSQGAQGGCREETPRTGRGAKSLYGSS